VTEPKYGVRVMDLICPICDRKLGTHTLVGTIFAFDDYFPDHHGHANPRRAFRMHFGAFDFPREDHRTGEDLGAAIAAGTPDRFLNRAGVSLDRPKETRCRNGHRLVAHPRTIVRRLPEYRPGHVPEIFLQSLGRER
jgi:hypothetical protein